MYSKGAKAIVLPQSFKNLNYEGKCFHYSSSIFPILTCHLAMQNGQLETSPFTHFFLPFDQGSVDLVSFL